MADANQPSLPKIPGFEILGPIGAGGMAEVFKARQISLDRIVAIKIMSPESTRDPKFVERFYQEGKAAAKLNHPNIIAALDVGKTDQFHYFVMEYVEGQTLYARLMEDTRLDEEEAVKVMLDIARALEHAHAARLIHRDIKPQNIIVTRAGVPKLLDMGLARQAGSDYNDSEKGKVLGSPYYVSPEQILNKPDIDFRTDLYSFGVTLYYMLTGKLPFDAPTAKEVMKKHLYGKLTSPRELNPILSEDITNIVTICMAKDPALRYDSTADLVQDLEAITEGGAALIAENKMRKLTEGDSVDEDASPIVRRAKGASQDQDEEEDLRPVRRGPIWRERMFWPAVVGWGVVLILLMVMMLGGRGNPTPDADANAVTTGSTR